MSHILVNDNERKLSKKFKDQLSNEVGEGRLLQVCKDLLTKHETNVPGLVRQIAPGGTSLLNNDTFYGVIHWHKPKIDGKPTEDPSKWEVDGIEITDKTTSATSHKISWCESFKIDRDGRVTDVYPEYTNGPQVFQATDLEKFFFFAYISKRVKNSKNAKANTLREYYMEIPDPEGEATAEINASKAESKFRYMISGDEGCWSDDHVKSIGRQLFLPVDGYKTMDLLRKAILNTLSADEKLKNLSGIPDVFGWKYGLEIAAKKGDDYELRGVLGEAKSKGVIRHDSARKAWVMVADEVVIGNICPCDDDVPIKENVLMSFLKHNPEDLAKIEKMVSSI